MIDGHECSLELLRRDRQNNSLLYAVRPTHVTDASTSSVHRVIPASHPVTITHLRRCGTPTSRPKSAPTASQESPPARNAASVRVREPKIQIKYPGGGVRSRRRALYNTAPGANKQICHWTRSSYTIYSMPPAPRARPVAGAGVVRRCMSPRRRRRRRAEGEHEREQQQNGLDN